MNKIGRLHESIRTLFRSEGEKFCYTPGEIERLVCSLNYKQIINSCTVSCATLRNLSMSAAPGAVSVIPTSITAPSCSRQTQH